MEKLDFRSVGLLAYREFGEILPLTVVKLPSGRYCIGTVFEDEDGIPSSRESIEDFKMAAQARAALRSGQWSQNGI